MVQSIINLGEREDRILTIVKGKYGLKNKSDAVNLVIELFEQELLEPELKPVYVKKIQGIKKKGKFKSYRSISALKKDLKNA